MMHVLLLLIVMVLQAMGNTSLGVTNTMQPCYDLTKGPKPNTLPTGSPNGTVCKDPDHYVFWDQ